MTELKTLYVTTREQWRDWLNDNFDKKKRSGLFIPKRKPGTSGFYIMTQSRKLYVLDGLTVLSGLWIITILYNGLLQEFLKVFFPRQIRKG